MADCITLIGIRAQGTHGCLDFEHTRPQNFSVDARLFLDLTTAGSSDDLADTVDYGQIAHRIVSVVEGPHCDLIESLAERIAQAILRNPRVRRVIVTVHKPSAPLTVPFDDVAATIERSRADGGSLAADADAGPAAVGSTPSRPMRTVVLSLGGNLGDVATAMREAIVSLDSIPGTQVTGISPLYRSVPWGMDESAPDFLNAVVQLNTVVDPMALLEEIHLIEIAHGRSREVHWGSRPLDIDIIDFGGLTSANPELTLPHPRAWQRAFVLAPWLDLDPDARLSGEHGGSVASLLNACPDKNAIERISDTWILGERPLP